MAVESEVQLSAQRHPKKRKRDNNPVLYVASHATSQPRTPAVKHDSDLDDELRLYAVDPKVQWVSSTARESTLTEPSFGLATLPAPNTAINAIQAYHGSRIQHSGKVGRFPVQPVQHCQSRPAIQSQSQEPIVAQIIPSQEQRGVVPSHPGRTFGSVHGWDSQYTPHRFDVTVSRHNTSQNAVSQQTSLAFTTCTGAESTFTFWSQPPVTRGFVEGHMNHGLGLSSSTHMSAPMQEANNLSTQQPFYPEYSTGGEQAPPVYQGQPNPFPQYSYPSPLDPNLVSYSLPAPGQLQQQQQYHHPQHQHQHPPLPQHNQVSYDSQDLGPRQVGQNYHIHFPNPQFTTTMGGGEFVPGFPMRGENEPLLLIGAGQTNSFTGHSYSAPDTGVHASGTPSYSPQPLQPTRGDVQQGTIPLNNFHADYYIDGGENQASTVGPGPDPDLDNYELITAAEAVHEAVPSDGQEGGGEAGSEYGDEDGDEDEDEDGDEDADDGDPECEAGCPLRKKKPRRPFDADRRKRTAETRKRRACLRCRKQRVRCETCGDDPEAACLKCTLYNRESKKTIHFLPCFRGKLTDAVLFRRGGLNLTRRWEGTDMKNVGDRPSPRDIRTIEITLDVCDTPMVVKVVRFNRKAGDVTARFWTVQRNNEDVLQKKELEPYCLHDIQDTAKYFEEYIIRNALDSLVKQRMSPVKLNGPSSQHGVVEWTYLKAWQHFHDLDENAGPIDRAQKTLMRDLFILWFAMRHTTGMSYICGEEKLGMEPEVNDETYPLFNKVSLPRMILAQFDSINYSRVLTVYGKRVLKRLEKLMDNRQPCLWWTIYLCVFILLREASWTSEDRYRHARNNYGRKIRYSIPTFVEELQAGCNNILMHWHYYNTEAWPNPEDPQNGDTIFLSKLESQKYDFVMQTLAHQDVQRHLRTFQRYREDNGHVEPPAPENTHENDANYTGSQSKFDWDHPFYWVSQIFDNAAKWVPLPTYQRESAD